MSSSRSERLVSMISASVVAVSAITVELPVQGLDALAELVFVFQAGIEPLEVGPVPEYVGLFSDRDPA